MSRISVEHGTNTGQSDIEIRVGISIVHIKVGSKRTDLTLFDVYSKTTAGIYLLLFIQSTFSLPHTSSL